MDPNNAHIPTVLALLRAALWGQDFSPTPETDWGAVRKELRHHAVHNLPVDLLAKHDEAHRMLYIQSSAKACGLWYRLMGIQQEIAEALQNAGIPCATLKGAAADIYYPQPLNRTMGDIDLLVNPGDFDRSMALLAQIGCELTDNRNPRHAEFQKNGVHIELHRHFAVLSHNDRAAQLDGMLFDALDRAQQRQLEGYSFFMLPPQENGIVLMEHINSHLESGLGLRQIIDWMLYVDQHLDDDTWFGGFAQIMEALGLEKLCITVTRMCQLSLGLRGNITWCQTADEALCHRLLAHTIQQGNFGRKQDRVSNGTVRVLNVLDSDLSFFQLLQRHGCYNWQALKRYPWLRPFAWIYQLCRYIRKGLRTKNPIGTFFRAIRRKGKNTDLLTELEVQRKDHTLEYE